MPDNLQRTNRAARRIMKEKSNDISALLESWYCRDNGAYLLGALEQALKPILDLTFGYHILQLGPLRDRTLQSASPIHHRIYAGTRPGKLVNLLSLPDELPLESDSVDAIIAFHCLEFSAHPHTALREMHRVLTPHGHLIVIGFSPFSIQGASSRIRSILGNPLWREHQPLGQGRLHDWLRLLGCEVEQAQQLYAIPPVGRGRFRDWLTRLDSWCGQVHLPLGGVYVMHSIKQVSGLNRPRERVRRGARLIGLAVPKPAATPSPVPVTPAKRDASTDTAA